MKAILLLLLTFALAPDTSNAQPGYGLTTDGRDFYVTHIPGAVVCTGLELYTYQVLLISSYYDNDIYVAYFDKQTGLEKTARRYSVMGGQTLQIRIDPTEMTLRVDDSVQYATCHITSKHKISVTYFATGPMNAGICQVIPTSALGKRYVVSTLPSNPKQGGTNPTTVTCTDRQSSGVAAIIATDTNTVVTITPTTRTSTGRIGVTTGEGATGEKHPYTVTLQRGQCFRFSSDPSSVGHDLTGSTIVSNKPIAVIAAHEAAFLDSTKNGGGLIDDRDVMVEQMIPVEYWRKAGHVTVPQFDSPPSQAWEQGYGELYKVVTPDTVSHSVTVRTDTSTSTIVASPYPAIPAYVEHYAKGLNFSSDAPVEVTAYQYKQVSAQFSPPYPAPSQMAIVPRERWTNRYAFAIPDINSIFYKSYYMAVIARRDRMDKIMVSVGGSLPGRKLTSYVSHGIYDVPGHSELQARRFQVATGSYHLYDDSAFALYQFGSGAMDGPFHGDLGDLTDGDDWYFCYASSAGQRFFIDGAPKPTIAIASKCDQVTITATDSTYGIADAELLYVYENGKTSNVALISAPAPQLQLSASYTLTAINPFTNAVADFRIVTKGGADTVIHWEYRAPVTDFAPDTLAFLWVRENADTCRVAVFRNLGGTLRLDSVSLSSPNFSYLTTPTLPTTLAKNDSLVISICFNGIAKAVVRDTVRLNSQSITGQLPLHAITTRPRAYADDINFDVVQVGTTTCKQLQLENRGVFPITLTQDWKLTGDPEFVFDDATRLPITLQPGEKVKLRVCYLPKKVGSDSARIDWAFESLLDQEKLFTTLKGRSVKPGINWSEDTVIMALGERSTHAVLLSNTETKENFVDSLTIWGPDATEFSIDRTFLPTPFDLGPGTSREVKIIFTPDLGRPGIRHAYLTAWDYYQINPVIRLFGYPSLAVNGGEHAFRIYPQPLTNEYLNLELPMDGVFEYEVVDILGRSRARGEGISSSGVALLDLSALASGLYRLRIIAPSHYELPLVIRK